MLKAHQMREGSGGSSSLRLEADQSPAGRTAAAPALIARRKASSAFGETSSSAAAASTSVIPERERAARRTAAMAFRGSAKSGAFSANHALTATKVCLLAAGAREKAVSVAQGRPVAFYAPEALYSEKR